MAKKKRNYVPRETNLLYEWVKKEYPDKLQWRRVRLGAIPGTPADDIYKGLRRFADLIVWDGKNIIIIEGKMRPQPVGLAELELYGRLFPSTPEFSDFKDKPIRLIFLTTAYDEMIEELAKEKGIELVVYRPDWIEEWEQEWIHRRKR